MLNKVLLGLSVVGICAAVAVVAFRQETQADKQKACVEMLAHFCAKAEECAAIPAGECAANVVCPDEIVSSVSQIKQCQADLATAGCGTPPQSCLELE